ncbi:putative sodium/calcium exchanger 7 (Na(+)/Ca(2+)-exchange protein 7) [Aphelenchoides bicaudatus]|nr:putative sodium/calcium exchanger 7 (Na(+)/Ca(2+)-exchange protein 7) [Aphelenchoides bicaudatus]
MDIICLCEESLGLRVFFIILAIFYMLYLLLFLGSATDDCLCTSISSIVDQLKISQNVAGVTFMAFGNGAADIFGMLVEVVASDVPKANLAIGQLLGGGMFVTTVVIAAIIFHKPFTVMRRPIIRDIVFFILALGIMLAILFYDDQMHAWQPLTLLVFYGIYVLTVVFGSSIRGGKFLCFEWETGHQRKIRINVEQQQVQATSSIRPKMVFTELAIKTGPPLDTLPIINSISPNKISPIQPGLIQTGLLTVDCLVNTPKIRSVRSGSMSSRRGTLIPVGQQDPITHNQNYMEHGKFFVDEKTSETEDLDSPDSSAQTPNTYTSDSISPSTTTSSSPISEGIKQRFLRRLQKMNGWEFYGLENTPWYSKIMFFLRIPITLFLRVTSPMSSEPWNKALSLFHCFTTPLIFLFSFSLGTIKIIPGGPGIWVYSLGVSAIAALLLAIFTSKNVEPSLYKYLIPYIAFTVAISWVFALAAEMVNVVMLFGVVSRISHVILGLTVLAWSNSVGDLVADLAVAKQGFPRMAISAAIGGPLLNLLLGFGLSFLVAILQGKRISIPRGEISRVLMVCFLIVSLISSLVILTVKRFKATKLYAIVLLVIYVVFLVVTISVELNVLKF